MLTTSTDNLVMLGVEQIQRNRYQPRLTISQQEIDELAASIATVGVLQPLVVRPISAPLPTAPTHELIAGERRWRAAQQAGLYEVPCLVKEASDQLAATMALVENVQREALTAVEEAIAIKRLIDEFGMSQTAVGREVGKRQSTVSHLLRMLHKLAPEVLTLVQNKALSPGHAKALMALPPKQQIDYAKRALTHHLSVRDVERLVRKWITQRHNASCDVVPTVSRDPDVAALLEEIGQHYGYPISLVAQRDGSGFVQIRYTSVEELTGVLERLQQAYTVNSEWG